MSASYGEGPLSQLSLYPRDATRGDVGGMAHVFISSLGNDQTAQLLTRRENIWPVAVEMLRNYLEDDYTHVIVAEDEYTGTIVGWTSVSLVTSGEDDYFKYCDSTVWAGREVLRREARARGQAPIHIDEMRRAGLITKLREHNRNGQNRHASGQRLVINTVAISPNVVRDEIPEIAQMLFIYIENIAREEHLPLWMQVPEEFEDDIGLDFEVGGFAKVGSFELNLIRYANEEHRRRRHWGVQRWTQWVWPMRN